MHLPLSVRTLPLPDLCCSFSRPGMLLLRDSAYRSPPPPCGYRWRAPIRRIQGKRASFSPSSSALLYSDMILAVHGSYQHYVPLRSLLCRECKSQLRSLLRNILLRSWSNPGDQACGKAIQLALRTLNYLFRLPPSGTHWSTSSDTHQVVEIQIETSTKMYTPFLIGLN